MTTNNKALRNIIIEAIKETTEELTQKGTTGDLVHEEESSTAEQALGVLIQHVKTIDDWGDVLQRIIYHGARAVPNVEAAFNTDPGFLGKMIKMAAAQGNETQQQGEEVSAEEIEESPGNKRGPHAKQGRGGTSMSGKKPRGTPGPLDEVATTPAEEEAEKEEHAAEAPGYDMSKGGIKQTGGPSGNPLDVGPAAGQVIYDEPPAGSPEEDGDEEGLKEWYEGSLYGKLLTEWTKK